MPDPNHFGCWCSQHRLSARSNNLGRCSLLDIEGKVCSKLLDKICFKCGAHKHPTNFKSRHLKKGCSDKDITMWNDALLGIEIPDKFVFEVAQEYQKRGSEYLNRKKRISADSQMMQLRNEELNKKIQELVQVEEAKRKENELKELGRTQMRPPLCDEKTFEFVKSVSLKNLDSELTNKYQRLESSTIDQFFHTLSLKHPRIKCISSTVFNQGIEPQEMTREYYIEIIEQMENEKIDFILAPRFVNNNHWCLLIFEKGGTTMFDPLYPSQEYNKEAFKHLFVLFSVERPLENKVASCLSVVQDDDNSCGPWICKYAELLAGIEQKTKEEKQKKNRVKRKSQQKLLQKPTIKMMNDEKKGLINFREKTIKECAEAIRIGGYSSVFRSLEN